MTEPRMTLATRHKIQDIARLANVLGWLIMAVLLAGVVLKAVLAIAHGHWSWTWLAAPVLCWTLNAALHRIAR